MATFSILPYPEFLSAGLKAYITDVSAAAGRHIVFCDGRGSERGLIASADVPEELPAAAIIIRDTNFRQTTYASQVHDPWIAHELTHIQLHAEGWPIMAFPDLDSASHPYMQAVYNWLTDPLINDRIENLGFSLAANRTAELSAAITAIGSGIWTANIAAGHMPDIGALRLFVSFSLEPGVAQEPKLRLRKVVRSQLPKISATGNEVLKLMQQAEWRTPDGYVTTATACLELLKVDVQKVVWRQMRKYTPEECVNWARQSGVPEVGWG